MLGGRNNSWIDDKMQGGAIWKSHYEATVAKNNRPIICLPIMWKTLA